MKKIILIALLSAASLSQAQRVRGGDLQINAGLLLSANQGIPIYAGADYGFNNDITFGGRIGLTFGNDYSSTVLSANSNYHFNSLLEIKDNWDVYAGLNLNFGFVTVEGEKSSFGPEIGLAIGGRYYFNNKIGINLELGASGSSSANQIGVSYRI